jgi:hypothetical protein
MTPNKQKLKDLTDRMLRELDDEGCHHAWYCLHISEDRLFMEAELKRLRAQAEQGPAAVKKPRKVRLGGNVVALRPK